MDANFKLKQKDRGFNDPPLSNGLVYMVANEKLRDHLAHCSTTGQVSEVSALYSDRSWRLLKRRTLRSDQHMRFLVQRYYSGLHEVC